MSEPSIREMLISDVDQVFAIEQNAYPFPWSKSLFEQAVATNKYACVMEVDDNIIGYAVLSFVVGEVELLNICISPSVQGKGYAHQLLTHLITFSEQRKNHEMFLEVRVSNAAAIHVYEKHGFNEIGRRKNYYPGKQGREDAILMALPLMC